VSPRVVNSPVCYKTQTMINEVQGVPKSNPLGKILYLWNCCRFLHQIYSVYRWGYRAHTLQILIK